MSETSGHAAGRKNRLAGESSPYLLLHQTNPVDWYPWGEEALTRAREEDKPIFLSVGYSTCYWCHVMERESFSDPEIAAVMNERFINIKVDREERPDLDEIYMAATQILTGQGGWPNSVFLTPDLKPFYAGTYFPPTDRHGRPGFMAVLSGLTHAWQNRREDVKTQSEELADAMKRYLEDRVRPGETPPTAGVALRAAAGLKERYDEDWGGFGGAPKFPTPSNLFLLDAFADGDPEAARMLAGTLDQMARGGIYDQLGGGFHRYATDAEWKVPHFEKMLYDNGLLLEVYARHFQRTADPEAARILRETAAFLAREMTSPDGAFLSAIDAETDGHEGAYYVWSQEELQTTLGPEDALFLAPVLGFAGPPFFEGSHYVLHLPRPLAEQAEERRMSRRQLLEQIEPLKAKLLAARDDRKRPLTDDKILADWNGMAIAGMARAGAALEDEALVTRAAEAARFVLQTMRPEGQPMLHSWRAGRGRIAAYLGDYVFMVRGLLALHDATGEERWLEAANELTQEQIRRLEDGEQGGFFLAAEDPDLLFRSKDPFDGALPSANAIAALNLMDLAERTGDEAWKRKAESTLVTFGPLVEGFPDGARMLALAAHRFGYQGEPGASAEAGRTTSPLDDEAQRAVASALTWAGEAEDGFRPFVLALEIREGWHVNANPASTSNLIPTVVRGEEGELADVEYPTGEAARFSYSDEPLAVYMGRVEIRGRAKVGRDAASLALIFQPCDEERCLPPVKRPMDFPTD